MKHQISDDSPLLTIPLILFPEREHPELITLLCLFNAQWITPLDKTEGKLGGLSQTQAQEFYISVYTQAKIVCAQLNTSSNTKHTSQPWTPELNPDFWLTSKQMTLFVQKLEIYKNLFFNYSSSTTVEKLLEAIPLPSIDKDKIPKEAQAILPLRISDLEPDITTQKNCSASYAI